MNSNDANERRDRWARLRFAVVGALLASPPPAGRLRAELERLADREWDHPSGSGPVLLRKPFRFHLAVDTLPSGCLSTVNRLSSSLGCLRRFHLRARLGIHLSAHPGR